MIPLPAGTQPVDPASCPMHTRGADLPHITIGGTIYCTTGHIMIRFAEGPAGWQSLLVRDPR